jgi:NitT/TauT family transport system substrate-binding protein
MGLRSALAAVAVAVSQLVALAAATAEPLKIAYSDWPGWVAGDVAVEKKLFAKPGVEVEFLWFDYVASMDAFSANGGRRHVTNDARHQAAGARSLMIIVNDYSGNDMVVAKPRHREVRGPEGQEDRRRGRLRRSPAAAQGLERRA